MKELRKKGFGQGQQGSSCQHHRAGRVFRVQGSSSLIRSILLKNHCTEPEWRSIGRVCAYRIPGRHRDAVSCSTWTRA
jgi:hypothetical protein